MSACLPVSRKYSPIATPAYGARYCIEAASLAVYLPLVEQTIGNAREIGIRAALTGPATRGDVGTMRAHLAELARDAPGVVDLYTDLAKREVDLAEARGAVAPEVARRARASLANGS